MLILLFVGMFLISLVSANLGTFAQRECVPIVTNLDAEAVNISILTDPTPNPTILLQNTKMTKSGTSFNYTFCGTNKTGTYTYGYCDNDGTCYSNDFEITPSGYGNSGATIAFFIVIILLIYGITFVGVFGRNIPITIMGGMAMIFLGIYLFNYGIIIFRDDLTRYISYVTIGIGAILAIWASYEWYKDM